MRHGMSHADAGKLGAEAAKVALAKQRLERVLKYNDNPVRCATCNKPLSYERRCNKYCSSSCAAKTNNTKRKVRRVQKVQRLCLNCGTPLSSSQRKYCTFACEHSHHWELKKRKIIETGEFPHGKKQNETDRRVVRRYLEEMNGRKCAICGGVTWNNQPIPLVTDHIDGDSTNHSVSNFRLICPNCDAQTATYKARNKNSTRVWRKKYYKQPNSPVE